MHLRPKTKKRLMILLIGGLAGAGVATAVVIVQLRRYENHLLAFRSKGLVAYHHGDYRTAAKDLASYLGNDRVDGEAIFAYAVTRSKLPRPDMGNLLDAQRLFNRYLEICPGDIDAEHQLLDIYQRLHYPAEVMDTASDLLKKNPDDVPALLAELQQLVHDQKYTEALPVSMQLNELTPYDIRTQETTFDLMARTGKSPAEIISRGDQLLSAHPNDPRFELIRALAAYFTSDLSDTKRWLRKAAAHNSPDGDFTLLLVGSFDHLGMWKDSRSLLEQTATQVSASAPLKAKFVQRLWEFGNFDAAFAVLKDINPRDPTADSDLLGLAGLVLRSGTHSATAYIDALNRRPDDPTAAAWVLLLAVISNPTQGDVLQLVQQCQTAEKLDPDNPDTRFYLAQQYLRMGESELALQCLRQTSAMQPEWSAVQIMIAQILLDRNQPGDAISPAQTACKIDADSVAAKSTLALAVYRSLGTQALPIDTQPVLDGIQQARKTNAGDSGLLAANVDLLARCDRKQEASALAITSLSDSPARLSQLATVDRLDRLGITKNLIDCAMQCQVTTPTEALDQVRVLATAGDLVDGEKCIAAMQSHTTPDWELAQLQGREALHDDAVGAAWKQFADSQPRNLQVQLAALHSPAVNSNRPLMDRTINRVKTLCSDDAIEWKMARAMWELSSPKDMKNSASAAAASMAEVARQEPKYERPQVIWADALVELGDITGAISHLRIAAQLEPADAEAKIKLAKLLTQQGQAHDTASVLSSTRGD